MGLNVKFPMSVRGDLKISGGAFGWDKKKKTMSEVQLAMEHVVGSWDVYSIKKKNEMERNYGRL